MSRVTVLPPTTRASTLLYLRSQSPTGKRLWMSIIGTNIVLYAPYAPKNIRYGGFGTQWVKLNREGVRKPLLLAGSLGLKTLSFQLVLASPDRNKTWDAWLSQAEQMSRMGARFKIGYGSVFESVYWRLTSFSFQSTDRHPSTNGILEATVDFEFTEAQDAAMPTGPVSGGVKTTSSNDSVTAGVSTPAGATKTHTVKAGETLSGLAVKYYQNANLWTKIATANNIKDPAKIKVGQVLRIP